VSEARVCPTGDENGRLKKIVAQQALDIDALKVVLSKKCEPPAKEKRYESCARSQTESGAPVGCCGCTRSCRYRRRERNDAGRCDATAEIAGERPRFGYRRVP